MRKASLIHILTLTLIALAGCQTSDSALREQGNSEAYVLGFHDGRHSGMKEAGNNWEHYIKDFERFESDTEYKVGWLAGEAEGKRLQAQATSIGNAAGGAYTGYQIGKEANKAEPHPKAIAKDVMKDVDTKELEALGK
jgi:hypothetical protein